MPYKADGFELRYPYRGSWNVDRYQNSRKIDQIPVGWIHRSDLSLPLGEKYTDIAFRPSPECPVPAPGECFVLALAKAVDEKKDPSWEVKDIIGIFEGESTGREFVQGHTRVRILRRVSA